MVTLRIPDALPLGDPGTCRVVAEAGQCGQGDVSKFIDMAYAARDAGCWGFKVQLLHPETIAHPEAAKYWEDSFGTRTQQEAFARAGIVPYDAWHEVKQVCDSIGIVFFATPFDFEAVDILAEMGVRLFKVASGDITHRPLIEKIAATDIPLVLSTGAATRLEVLEALRWFHHDDKVVLLACTLSYPTPPASAHLARITALLDEFPLVGYSDHTLSHVTAMPAAAMGACLLEKHFTHDRTADDVPDHAMALDPKAMTKYVRWANHGAQLRGSESMVPDHHERDAHLGARRSIFAVRDLPAGHTLAAADMVFLRPGGGYPPARYRDLIGKRLVYPVKALDPLR